MNDEEDDCCICLEAMNSKPKMEMECNHIVHTACGISWLKREKTCPICRR